MTGDGLTDVGRLPHDQAEESVSDLSADKEEMPCRRPAGAAY